MTYQADIILNYFNVTNIPLSDPSIQFLHEIDQISSNTYYFYQNVTLNKKLEIDQNVDLLMEEINDSKDELVAAFSEFEYYFLIQLALNIKQVNDVMYGMAQGDQKNYRDLYMAENTLWTADVFGVDTKVALWAHNMHVSNLDSFGSMGSYLKEELHYEYQIIGFSFSDGSFTAVRMVGLNPVSLGTIRIWREPKYGSINYIFHHAQYDNFILQASDIQENSSFDIYISQSQYFLQIGAGFSRFLHLIGIYYVFTDLMEEYDVVIHWDTTETAEQLR
jgi:erythromycin esterase-like protein